VTGSRPLDALFEPPPDRWGLRGDPHVWRELQSRLAGRDRPATPTELVDLLRSTFRDVVGVDPFADDAPEQVYRAEFAHGGISSGTVSLSTWRERLIPLLEARAAAMYGHLA
jgi:hypothetical protein